MAAASGSFGSALSGQGDAAQTQNGFHFFVRQRAAEQIALQLRASSTLQKVELFGGFDAFGNDVKIEAAGHGDDRGGDPCIVGILRQAVDETLVDFQRADREALDIRQR